MRNRVYDEGGNPKVYRYQEVNPVVLNLFMVAIDR